MITSRATKGIALVLVALFAVPAAVAIVTPRAHRGSSRPTLRFSIQGKARRLIYPGAKPVPIAIRLGNPNRVAIVVTRIRVSLRTRFLPAGCGRAAFRINQVRFPRRGVRVPPWGHVTLQTRRVKSPTIKMQSTGNQDRCQGLKLRFAYTGRAHS